MSPEEVRDPIRNPQSAIRNWDKLAFAVATFLGIGYIPGPTGTYGSLATAVLFALFTWPDRTPDGWRLSALILVIFFVGVAAADRVARAIKNPDPKIVIVDEVVGQLATWVFVPVRPSTLIVGFFLFRLFDVLKPPPARQFEALHGGWGIVSDDLMAGIYANLVLQVLVRFVGL